MSEAFEEEVREWMAGVDRRLTELEYKAGVRVRPDPGPREPVKSSEDIAMDNMLFGKGSLGQEMAKRMAAGVKAPNYDAGRK